MNSHVARLISPNRLRLAGYRPARETHHKSVRAYVLPQPRDPPSPLHSPFPSVPASEEGAAGLGRGKIAAKWISVSLSVAAGSFFFFVYSLYSYATYGCRKRGSGRRTDMYVEWLKNK